MSFLIKYSLLSRRILTLSHCRTFNPDSSNPNPLWTGPKSKVSKSIKWSKVNPNLNIGGTYYELFGVDIGIRSQKI